MSDVQHVCCYCGKTCGDQEPATFRCCGEVGHCEPAELLDRMDAERLLRPLTNWTTDELLRTTHADK